MLDAGVLDRSGFSPATYDATIDHLHSGMRTLTERLAEVGPSLDRAVSRRWVPSPVAEGLTWCADRLLDLGRDLLRTLRDLLEGAAAPVLFFVRAYEWVTEVGSPASGVAATIHPNALRATRTWTGDAAAAYRAAAAGQSPAAAQIQSVSSQVTTSLCTCAAAGLAFYVALGVILSKFLTAMAAAIAALGSVVFSWAGLLVILEEAAVNTGMVVAAVAAFTAAQGAAAAALVNVTSASRSQTAFPHGRWPAGTA